MKKAIQIIAKIILYIAAYFIAVLASQLLFNAIATISVSVNNWIADNSGIITAGTCLLAVLIIFGIFGFKKKEALATCRFRRFDAKIVPLLLLTGVALGVFSIYFVNIPYIAKWCPPLLAMLTVITGGKSILIVMVGPVLLGSFIEEVVFRGLLLNEIRRGLPNVISLLLHGVIFAILYGFIAGNSFVGLYAAIGALIFGWMYICFNSIWAPVITHVTSSICLAILNRTDSVARNIPFLVGLLSAILLLAALYGSFRMVKKQAMVQ